MLYTEGAMGYVAMKRMHGNRDGASECKICEKTLDMDITTFQKLGLAFQFDPLQDLMVG